MKFPLRLAHLLLTTSAVLGTFVACGDNNSNTDDDSNGGAGGEGNPGVSSCVRPGESWCVGTASGLTCPEGVNDPVEFTCANGDICDDGECKGQCEAGETECVNGSTQRVCTADGRSWVTLACQDGEVCEDGSCGLEGGLTCVPGAHDCKDDGTARTCKQDGSGWVEEDCPGETACSDGACRGSVCAVGAKKCDPATLDLPSAFLFSEGADPPLDVIFTCTDGEHWEVSPCPTEDEQQTFCAYSGVDPSVVNGYRAQVNNWFIGFMLSQQNDTAPPAPPTPPALSEFAQAECVVPACPWEMTFFESAAASRECGDYTEDGEEVPEWKAFSQCEGFLPYSNTHVEAYQCTGMTACSYYAGPNAGCSPVDCLPGEYICGSSTSYQSCDTYSFQFSEGVSCPDVEVETPGACAETGSEPNRRVTCDGEEVTSNPQITAN